MYNFSPGPAILAKSVSDEIANHFSDALPGLSILEISHRSGEYETIHNSAIRRCRSLYGLPDDMEVLLVGGGASLQFAMVPINLLRQSNSADYIETGSWSQKALSEAVCLGKTVRVAGSSADRDFCYIPGLEALSLDEAADYVHVTSNNTIIGTQFRVFPDTNDVPKVVDMTSDLFSRPVSWEGIGLAYGGTQKNAGIAGCTVVFVRRDLLSRETNSTPAILRYSTFSDSNSLYNTPPVFSVYVLNLTLEWLELTGGLEAAAIRNERKAKALYDVIDRYDSVFRGYSDSAARSYMNVTFDLSDREQSKHFSNAAAKQGFLGIEGHRSIGGYRASLYNGMPLEGCEALAEFMRDFALEQ